MWAGGTGTMVAKSPYSWSTLTTNYSYVKGQTLSGTGNLAGSTDPRLRTGAGSDPRILYDSPLRGAGGSGAQSLSDMDLEARSTTTPDIGADQFVDTDSDDLPDQWEIAQAGNLTTLSGTGDPDSDGLTNAQEYATHANPAVADTDGDGLSDGAEVNTHGTNPTLTDTDGDDMPDAWEVTYGLSATTANAFDDADGDRYPNVFEWARSTDPSSASSLPTANYTVDINGGGTHTSVSAALTAANVSNGAYQVIAIAPGTYTGAANLRDVTVASTKPKLLFIGTGGAGRTIIDGGGTNSGWLLRKSAVVASLTFTRASIALYVDASGVEARFVDLILRKNAATVGGYPGAVYVAAAAKTVIVGSTFVDNTGYSGGQQISFQAGTASMLNTVVWTSGTGTQVGTVAPLATNYCLVKGQTLTGTGNLAGTTDPKFRSDFRLKSDSPLRGAGGATVQSRIDIDGETRPSSAPDIGVDQFNDADSDSLPDSWEVGYAGNTTTLSGSSDTDNDGLTSSVEYALETNPVDPDTDDDGLKDGLEVSLGLNPRAHDSDDLPGDANGDGLLDALGLQLGHEYGDTDTDGDGVSNADEKLMCIDPLRSDSDGDGIPDSTDAFPLDPLVWSLPTNSSDVTAPVITLTSPWYAVEQ